MVTQWLPHHRFLDRERVRRAVIAAEAHTTAVIHVSTAPYFWGNVYRTAERAFKRLRIDRSPERNGVLFFIVPSRRRFVVLGDVGAHEKVGQKVWDDVRTMVEERFRAGDPTGGVIAGIEELGRRLAEHFPRKGDS